MTWFVDGYFCSVPGCETRLTAQGRESHKKKCGRCNRLEREARKVKQ